MSPLSIKKPALPDWFRKNKRLRTAALICAGLLCVDLLLYTVLLVPSAASLRASEARYSELRKRRAEALMFEKQKQQLAGIKAGIPTQKDMPLLMKELAQSARTLHLSVSSIGYQIPKRSADELVMLTFPFPASGRYADVKRFIYEVETSDRLVGIQDLKLGQEQGVIRMDMKLMTYVKGQ